MAQDTRLTAAFNRIALAINSKASSSTQARFPFVNSWTGSAWTYTTLTAAQSAGLMAGQIVWHIGGTAAPGWARAGDVWTTGT